MKIWVDADACPVVIKEVLYRAAERTGTQLTLVANQALQVPNSSYVNTLQVPRGFDVADDEIVKRLEAGEVPAENCIPPRIFGRASTCGISSTPCEPAVSTPEGRPP
jgi:hypothetical protein